MARISTALAEPSGSPASAEVAAPGGAVDLAMGADLYNTRCASCHGDRGQGGLPTQMIDSNPYFELRAESFRKPLMLKSLSDAAGFDNIVLHGLPGRMMAGSGTLTRGQLDSLYAYVRQLPSAPASAQGARP